jgi:micrococcal nuclease
MENQTYDNTPRFTLKNKRYNAKILDIYDADTITVCIDLEGFSFVKINVRLYGIDTPELRGSQKELGLTARNYLINTLTNIVIDDNNTRNDIRNMINKDTHMIEVLFGDFDKYGRPLAIIYKDNININEMLVKEGYAKEYDGGTKDAW